MLTLRFKTICSEQSGMIGYHMVRKVMRVKGVLDATGWALSTLYWKISEGRFPAGTKLDPNGKAVVWFEDEVEAWQDAAVKEARS